jgi:hypothetical protein
VWKIKQDQSDTVSKAADPGKFKDERKWPEWEPFFVNYLSTIHGVSGVPLSYVVRLKETPDPMSKQLLVLSYLDQPFKPMLARYTSYSRVSFNRRLPSNGLNPFPKRKVAVVT